jgi:hypothetical protein
MKKDGVTCSDMDEWEKGRNVWKNECVNKKGR